MPRITRNEFVTHLEGITAVLGALTYAGVDLPKWLPNGDDIKTVEQLAAVMGVSEQVAYVAILQTKAHVTKDAEAQKESDNDNLYEHTKCHHTSIGRTLGIKPGQFIMDEKGDRYVRTWKGVLRFGLPIGALIVPNTVRPSLKRASVGRDNYIKRSGRHPRVIDYSKIGVVHSDAKKIANNYHRIAHHNPKTDKAYRQLAKEINEQYDYLTEELGVNVEATPTDPYPSAKEMMEDVRKNNRLRVLSAESTGGGHATVDNDTINKFRAVHDFFGHAATGRDFSRHGEEAAWISHSQMFSPLARLAMTSGTRGQNSVLTVEQNGFPEQKSDILDPEWIFLPEQFGGDEQDRRDILNAIASLDEGIPNAGTEVIRNAPRTEGQTARRTVAAARKGNGWSRSDGRRSRINVGDRTDVVPLTIYAPSDEVHDELQAFGADPFTFYELDPNNKDSARQFHDAIAKTKEGNSHAAAVWVYDEDEYKDMRLFVGNDGLTGFALKSDGDIVSVFNRSPARRSVSTIMPLAIQEGGTKADCFDTKLPLLYAPYGFVETARFPFDPAQAPPDWRDEDFMQYNNGHPDVVFIEFDERQIGLPWGAVKARTTDEKYLDLLLEFKTVVRHVRKPEYWGLPYGTPIPAGYKPIGRHRTSSKPRSGPNTRPKGKDTDLHTYDPGNPQTWWLGRDPKSVELEILPDGTRIFIHDETFENDIVAHIGRTHIFTKNGPWFDHSIVYDYPDTASVIRRNDKGATSVAEIVNDQLVKRGRPDEPKVHVDISYPGMPPVPIYGSHRGLGLDFMAGRRNNFALKPGTMPQDMIRFTDPIDLAVLSKGTVILLETGNSHKQYIRMGETDLETNSPKWEPLGDTDNDMLIDVPFSDKEMLQRVNETIDLGGIYAVADANSTFVQGYPTERRRLEIRTTAGLNKLSPGSHIEFDVYDTTEEYADEFVKQPDGSWVSVGDESRGPLSVSPADILQKWKIIKAGDGAIQYWEPKDPRESSYIPIDKKLINYEYNELGFDADGYNEYGYDASGYNSDGFDENGYDAEGYDEYGYNEDGWDSEGYDQDGFDQDGVNRDGADRYGNYPGDDSYNGSHVKGTPRGPLATRDMDYNWQDRTPEIEAAEQLPSMQEIWDKIQTNGLGDNHKTYAEDIKAIYEMRMDSGLSSEVSYTRYDEYENAITIEGVIRTPDNQRAGTFTRKIYTHTDGSLSAENYYLKVEPAYQGHGFASEFNRNLENWYIANGFSSVRVHADIDKGGYSWARDGFDWESNPAHSARTMIDRIRDEASRTNNTAAIDQLDDMAQKIDDLEDDIPTPFELSNIGWEPGKSEWPGRQGMMNSDWYGVKNLNPNARALNVARELVQSGRAESKVKKKKNKGVFVAKEGVVYVPPVPQAELNIAGMRLYERAQVWAPDATLVANPSNGFESPYTFRTKDGYSYLLWEKDDVGSPTMRAVQFRSDDPAPLSRDFTHYESVDSALETIQLDYEARRDTAKNKREASRLKRLLNNELQVIERQQNSVQTVPAISRDDLPPEGVELANLVDNFAPDAAIVEVDNNQSNSTGPLYRVRTSDGYSYYMDAPGGPPLLLPAPAFVSGDIPGRNEIQRFDDTESALRHIQNEYGRRQRTNRTQMIRPADRTGWPSDVLTLAELVDENAPDATVVKLAGHDNRQITIRTRDGYSYWTRPDFISGDGEFGIYLSGAYVPGDVDQSSKNPNNEIREFSNPTEAMQFIQSEYIKRKMKSKDYLDQLERDIEKLLRPIS